MTDKKPTPKNVKVAANILLTGLKEGYACTHWGVKFSYDGKQMVATLPKAKADEMVKANRVTLV